ncbi:MAG: hypothetical protein FWG05_04775, partial [Kiritimatiellaeota bacterium]|nr:hypothetical protein [Kiritimatiellota bacterium]
FNGNNIFIADIHTPMAYPVGNYIEAAAFGTIDGVGTIIVGRDIANNTNNFVRTSGGIINCAAIAVRPGNGLSPIISAEMRDTGIINTGAATFGERTFVRPHAEKGAPADKYKILESETEIVGAENLAIDPQSEGNWKLYYDDFSVWLRYSLPMTVIIVK